MDILNILASRRRRTGVAVAVGAMLVAGCSVPAGSQNGTGDADSLVVALSTFGTESALPWQTSQTEKPLFEHAHDFLLYRDPDTFELQPGLATSWEHTPDFKTWTFELREGVPFHGDWGEFTSADVRYVIDQNLKPDATGGGASFLQENVASVETPDDYTVVLHMKSPSWQVADEFAQVTGYHFMTSAKYVEEVGEKKAAREPIGTGSYRFVSGSAGDSYEFEAVEDHWRQTPDFKTLTIRKIEDASTALLALEAGEVDIAPVSSDQIEQAEGAGLQIIESENATMQWVSFTGLTDPGTPDYCADCPWIGDPSDAQSLANARKVREAMSLAIDKQALIDAAFGGRGGLEPFGNWYWPYMPGFDSSWQPLDYDPERAKQLLAEAGHPDGFEFKFAFLDPSVNAASEVVVQYWRQIGIDVKTSSPEMGDMLDKLRARDTGIHGFVYTPPGGYSEMPLVAGRSAVPDGVFCFVGCTSENGREIAQITNTTDEEKRGQLAHDLQQRWYDDVYSVNLAWRSAVWAATDEVGDWPLVMGYRYENNYSLIEAAE